VWLTRHTPRVWLFVRPLSFIRDECDHWDDALLWPTGCGLWPETVGTQLGVPCGGNSRKQVCVCVCPSTEVGSARR
jgi:hypothetical protein